MSVITTGYIVILNSIERRSRTVAPFCCCATLEASFILCCFFTWVLEYRKLEPRSFLVLFKNLPQGTTHWGRPIKLSNPGPQNPWGLSQWFYKIQFINLFGAMYSRWFFNIRKLLPKWLCNWKSISELTVGGWPPAAVKVNGLQF